MIPGAGLEITTLAALRSSAPAVDGRTGDGRAIIRRSLIDTSTRVIVLDDDPTGTQSVHNIPVLTRWELDDLRWAFGQPTAGFFILTNTRGLNDAEAVDVVTRISSTVARVAAEFQLPFRLIARGDSTLRGHYPVETDALADAARRAGDPYDALLLAPAYFAAGRVTVNDIHYVEDGDALIPVGQTKYADDATFGFTSSNLRAYVEEKTAGLISATDVASVGLRDIRGGGVDRVRDIILAATGGTPIVVNALDDADLDVVVLGLIAAESQGHRVLCRTGPSFVAARLGLAARAPLSYEEIFVGDDREGHGLVVVGSHVDLTSRQVNWLVSQTPDLAIVELDVPRLLDMDARESELSRCADGLATALRDGETMLVTSRNQVVGESGHSSLVIAQTVSAALSALVARCIAMGKPRWVLAKGGITSSDVATEGLGIRRATVVGQLFPGIVSVWRHEGRETGDLAGLPYVIFAGNVGDDASLADAVAILRGDRL